MEAKVCPGCEAEFKPKRSKQILCSAACYRVIKAGKGAPPPEGYKRCNTCAQEKLLAEYAKRAASKDGLQHRCRACVAKWQDDNRERRRVSWSAHAHRIRLAKYGITQEFLEQEIERVGTKCEICRRDLVQGKGGNGLVIDHNHATNKYRGILCSTCNKAIGCFDDSADLLESAIRYLRQRAETH